MTLAIPLRKRFGQHFLHERGIIDRIVAAVAPQPNDKLVEIGPGGGALTEPLTARLDRLHVIEIDRDVVAALERSTYAARLVIHSGDVLEFDFAALPSPLRIVGNLPYNISTPILFHLAGFADRIVDMHLMLQREVVDRMVAAPSTSAYGRLSVMLQARFAMTRLFRVAAGAFHPPPKVESAVVRVVPHREPTVRILDDRLFGEVVTSAFTKRRKTLRNALADRLSAESLASLGIDPSWRPENLDVAAFAAITNYLAATDLR